MQENVIFAYLRLKGYFCVISRHRRTFHITENNYHVYYNNKQIRKIVLPHRRIGGVFSERHSSVTMVLYTVSVPLQWRHNGRNGVSKHQPHGCLLNRLFRFIQVSKKTSKFRVTGLCVGNSPVTGEFPAQRTNNAENVSIWWRHHAQLVCTGK